MAQHEQLSVEKRTIFGKQLKKLRREGILPANVYGKNIQSTAVQLPFKDFMAVYSKAGSTGLIDLTLDKDTYPVLVHNIAIHTLTRDPIHADFFIVNLKEKITANIPVVAEGEPTAVTDKTGMLLQLLNEVEIEALPSDLPESIVVDVTSLAAVGDQMTVESLKAPKGVTILNEAGQAVFRIDELVSEEAEALEAEEEAAAEAASEESTAEETEKADGDKTESTESSEEKPQE
ncbi:MAG TPA: 50S ribosomal protein L25 [Candidatus Levybacteria bacterium]|nr:50S ribosomal protein L25 [Candidatus Levybacteria bacterium]